MKMMSAVQARNAEDEGKDGRYKTRQQAADYIGVSVRLVDKLTASGDLPRIRLGGPKRGRVVFDTRDLDALMDRNKQCGNVPVQAA